MRLDRPLTILLLILAALALTVTLFVGVLTLAWGAG